MSPVVMDIIRHGGVLGGEALEQPTALRVGRVGVDLAAAAVGRRRSPTASGLALGRVNLGKRLAALVTLHGSGCDLRQAVTRDDKRS